MRILSGYHFRDMHQVILNREKGTNTTSRTAHAVCIQIAACFVFAFPFENQICQGSSFWQSLDISGGWISNTFDDYHNVMVNLKNNIALMVDGQGKKQTKQVKHWVLPVYTIGPCFVLNLLLEKHFFARVIVLTNTGYIRGLVELSLTDYFSDDCQKNLETPQNFLRIVILRIFLGSSSPEFSEDRHPQNFLRILKIFWGPSSSECSEDRHPQNFLKILRFFWGSSEFSEGRHPQNFLRILRIFWRSSEFLLNKLKKTLFSNKKTLIEWKFWWPSENSEDDDFFKLLKMRTLRKFSEDDDLQKILRILRKFWGWRPSENSEDPQKILRMTILRKFWGWRSSENSADEPQKSLRMTILRKFWGSSENSEDPQKILRMTILRKFWRWRSSENSEDPQKILSLTILRKFWGSSKSLRMRILKKIWRFLSKIWRLLRTFWWFLSKFLRSVQIFLITIKKFWYIMKTC